MKRHSITYHKIYCGVISCLMVFAAGCGTAANPGSDAGTQADNRSAQQLM